MGLIADFLKSIQFVSGPVSLFAFVAVVCLAIYYRSVKEEKGLEYLFALFRAKTDRETFYRLSKLVIERTFWFFFVFLVLAFLGYLIPSIVPPPNTNSLEARYQERFIRAVAFSNEAGNYGQAVRLFKEILQKYPRHIESHAGLGKAYYNLGSYTEALEAYRAASMHDPADPSYEMSQGLVAAKMGNDVRAIQLYASALAKGPEPRTEEKIRYVLGNAYRRQGERDKDDVALEKALSEYRKVKNMNGEFKTSATFNWACTNALRVKGADDEDALEAVIGNLRETLSADKSMRRDLILGTKAVECSENLVRLRGFPRYLQFVEEVRTSP